MLSKKLHISWLICWLCFGIIFGIGISATTSLFLSTPYIVLSAILIFFGFINKRAFSVIFIILAGFLIGYVRGAAIQSQLSDFYKYAGKEVTITGQVSDDVNYAQNTEKKFKIKNLKIDGTKASGEIWVSSFDIVEIKRSDVVKLKGSFAKGFGGFAGAIYKAKILEVKRPAHIDVARDIRDWFANKIRSVISEPAASLGIGFLVGQRSTLPEDLSKSLQILGLTHIVVASGYNLTILVRLARRLFSKISKYLATSFALGLMVFFIFMIGFGPSMIRAGIITTLSLLAWYFGRSINPVILLAFAGAITSLFNPSYIWGDIGWYLSFLAFAGVIILSPLLLAYFFEKEKPSTILQIASETTSAQIMTLPIIALSFGQISILAIPANAIILPFIPFTMLFTFLAGIFAIILPGLAILFAWPTHVVLSSMIKVSEYLSNLSFAQRDINLDLIQIALYYVFVIFIIFWLKSKTKHSFKNDNLVE